MGFSIFYFFGLLVFAASSLAGAQDLVCDSDSDVCTVLVAENYCRLGETAKTKWDIRTGEYILSCECNCTSQENTFWLVSGANKASVRKIETGKIVSTIDLKKNKDGVPDVFGLVPYCTTLHTDSDKLVSLQKIPSASSTLHPYCYEVDASVLSAFCSTSECKSKKELVAKVTNSIKAETLIEFKNATARLYKDKVRFQDFPKRVFVEKYIAEYAYSVINQQSYNDIAYYWQQADFNEDAIWLLEKVISNSPDRTVAYLNIADAYWSKGDRQMASANYKKYADLMVSSGKQKKIPERVNERSKL
ncbi:hypothetical protein [Pseudomonas sp. P9_31]|uniref:tetratricopeptide repeat protein n=1 Tax=Pseudomonas sp. P9_31 TaxID=3043448 RepID=UPI002A3585D0|nr:hypothetical protein [Pseudomonas sp. P9_31]WPN57823.1 hypothetical protein QMK51_27550 [Pseudomonas sp. P9_31]